MKILEQIRSFFNREDPRAKEMEELRRSIESLRQEMESGFASMQTAISEVRVPILVEPEVPVDDLAERRKKILEQSYLDDLKREPRKSTDHGLIPPGADLTLGRANKQHKDGFPRLRTEKE